VLVLRPGRRGEQERERQGGFDSSHPIVSLV
jgi:hypothetical protein